MTPEQLSKFWSKVNKTETCWLWLGSLASAGYGHMYLNGKSQSAHRLSYELVKGKVPVGLELDHLCRVRGCVNPDHLEAVTHRENVLRGIAPAARNAVATHCPNGHEYSKENTYYYNDGRACRSCRKLRKRTAASVLDATWDREANRHTCCGSQVTFRHKVACTHYRDPATIPVKSTLMRNIRQSSPGRWQVRIRHNTVLQEFGVYSSIEEAVIARDKALSDLTNKEN